MIESRSFGDNLMANDAVNRFFGGPPLSVAIRIILLSVLVGVILSAIGLDPRDISFQKLEFRLSVMSTMHRVRKIATKLIFWSGR